MNGPDESSQKNDQDISIPNPSNQAVGNAAELAPPPELPETLIMLQTLANRLQAPDIINSDSQTHEQRTQPQTAAPSIDGGASPEAMLNWLQIFADNMKSSIENTPDVANIEAPSAVFPSHLPTIGHPRTDGPTYTYKPAAEAMKEFKDLLGTVGRTFTALDVINARVQGAISGLDGRGQAIPSPPSSSRQGGTPSDAFPLLASLIDTPSSPTKSPYPQTNNSAPPDTPPAPFNTTIPIHNTARRAYITNEILLQAGLHKFASFLQSLPEDDPKYFIFQSVFGLTLLHLYEVNWDDEALDAGIGATSLALKGVVEPNEFSQHIPTVVRSWLYGQRLLVQRDGDIEKLALPIWLLKQYWAVVENLHAIPIQVKRFLRTELGACLFDQYTATGNLDDLDSAIEHLLALSEDGDTLGHDMAALGLAYYERFLQCGELDDLDRALHLGQKACGIGDAPPSPPTTEYDPDAAAGWHLFGLALTERFKMSLDIGDLDKAITNCQKAIALLSPAHPLFSPYKAALGRIFFARYEAQDLRVDDIYSALEVIQSAVSLSKGGLGRHTRVPPEAVQGYFMAVDGEKRNDIPAVQQGIRYLSNARRMFSGPSYLESYIENYLSQAMTCCFRLTTSNDDLEMALHHASLAYRKAHEGSPYLLQFELEFGRLLMTSYERGHYEHCDEAIAHFCSVAMSPTWPSIRLDAAIRWADAAELRSPEGVIDALEVALSILPSLVWVGNRMSIQYRMLASQQSAIANRAAAYALDAGDPAKAISYLESGRNILWAQSLQLRPEHMLPAGDERQREFKLLSQHLSRERHSYTLPKNPEQMAEMLQDIPPEYLRKLPPDFLNTMQSLQHFYIGVRRRLVEIGGAERVARDFARSREFKDDFLGIYQEASLHSAAKRWDKLRSNLDELQGKLSPAPSGSFSSAGNSDLIAAVNQGSIIIINAYRLRCDAIVISANDQAIELRHIPLSDISGVDAQAWAETLRQGMQDLQKSESDITIAAYEEIYLMPVLRNLWKGLACPLLDHLRRSGDIKRVWWYPTGPFMFLPVHAASPCEKDQPGLPELLTSSYIPSIYSLIRAFKSSPAPFRILAVGQPDTPEHSTLPSVAKEIKSIQELCQDTPESLTTMIGENGTVHQVMTSLPEHTSLHFSCHAHQDEIYPFHSAFYLHNGQLKLSKLMDLDLSRVQFAYLSACLTSAGDVGLPDECIHLAAGMQFAGVRSVVATMWDVDDQAAAMAASKVYRHLLRNGVEKADTMEAAEALHKSILEMKVEGIPLACRVPFIHLGV